MKEQLGNFRILEQIDKGGDTVVYRAEEDLGQGITRPAAVKVLQTLKLDDEEQMTTLKREVGILLAVSNSPNIVTVYGFGVDEDEGAWIAMELAGKSLKHYVTDKPADPDQVRVLLRDALNGLRVCHSQNPPVVHRDLKPNNILSNNYGTWQIADFGLAKRSDSSDTLNVMTVKYAAPEMLDAQLGEDSPKLDIYSLGVVAYEYALGQELFRQQFPSVYDPQGGGGGDERPKWMYFHTSMQMTVPPLKEVIEDYPEDLSDLIASMMTKPVRERIDSAELCLRQLGDVRGSIASTAFVEDVDVEKLRKKEGKIPKPALFGAIGLLFIVLCVVAAIVFKSVNAPTITLAKEEWQTSAPKVTISGTIENYGGTAVEIRLRDNSTWPVQVDDTGAFAADIRVPTVGETYAFLTVYDAGRNPAATRQLDIVRTTPETVEVTLVTRPSVEGAKVTFTPSEGGSPVSTQTDPQGQAEASVPHGRFKLSVEHPRFDRIADAEYATHDDPRRTIAVAMKELSNEALDAARSNLLAQLEEELDNAAGGDAAAKDRLKEIRDALHRLGPGAGKTGPVLERLDQVVGDVLDGDASSEEIAAAKEEIEAFETAKALAEVEASGGRRETVVQGPTGSRTQQLLTEMNGLTDRAAAGDRNAQKRLKEIQGELSAIAERELTGDADERGALLQEAAELAERAANGDPTALERLKEVQSELAQLSSGGSVNPIAARRNELLREVDDLAAAAAAGDPAAIARLREVQGELADLAEQDLEGSPESQRRRALLAEMDDLAERAANGDVAAVERMKDVQRQLAALDAQEKRQSAEGDREARRAQLLAEMDDLEERAAAGDPAAVARLKEVKKELAKLDAQATTDPAKAAKAERRAALLEEMAAVSEAAANGDPAAQKRLAEIRDELVSLDGGAAEEVARSERGARRAALLEEMESLADAAAAGDPKAIARLAEIKGELKELNAADVAALVGGPNDARKREILAEMDRLAEAAANGDPAALARMNELKGELASLDAIDAAGTDPGSKAAKRAALVRDLDGVADRAAAGDREAIARVDGIRTDLAALDDSGEAAAGSEAARRDALVREMESLVERAAAGDPAAIARLAEVQKELAEIDGDAVAAARSNDRAARRAAILNEMDSLAEAAAAGDPEAKARMAELRKELGELNAEELADNEGANRFKKAALVREMNDLAAKAAAGDPAAIERMREIKNELASLDAQDFADAQTGAGGVANERAALVREMEGLAARAANGDRAAQARLAEVRKELQELDAVEAATTASEAGASKRAALVDELASLQEAAANGDVRAQARVAEIQQELAKLDAEDAAGTAPKVGESKRKALTAELDDLADKAAQGDRKAAGRLREVSDELAALSDSEQALAAPPAGASKRAALVDEMGSLMDAAASGDRRAQQRIREIQQELTELEGDEIAKQKGAERAAKRKSLIAEMESLEEAAAAGDPAAQARIAEIQQELGALADEELAGAPSDRKAALLQEMKAVAARAAEGDPAAIARLAEIQDELEHVDAVEGNAAAAAGSTAARRQALLREMDEVAKAAAAGDPAAKARLAEIQQELKALSDQEVAAGGASEIEQKRAALVDELADVQARAAAGDPAAQKRLKEIRNELAQLDEQERQESVAGRRAALLDELAEVEAAAAAGDPAAQARLKEIQQELAQLEGEDDAQSVASRRAALTEELKDVQARAAAGDPAAKARLKEIQQELAQLDAEEETQSVASRRAALVDELAEVQKRAAAGDPAAQARLKEIQQELAQLDEEEEAQSVASRREALLDELEDVEKRAAAGDPAAKKRLKEIQQELAQLDAEGKAGSVASRRAALIDELAEVQKRAAAGDPAAKARLKEIQQELAQLDAEEARESVGGRRAELLAELEDVQKRAAAGDPAAQKRLKEIQGELAKLDAEEKAGSVESKRAKLLAELEDVQKRAAAGDPAAQARLKEIQKELVALDEEEKRASIQERRQELLAEMDDLAERAAAGDPVAAARLKEIRGELAQLDAEEAALETGSRRAELVAEAESLAARAAAGDPAAKARLKEIQKELAALGEEERAADPKQRRQELVEELGELTEGAAAGEAVAAEQIKDVKKELAKLEDEEIADDAMTRRRKLIAEMNQMIQRAAQTSSQWELAAAIAQMKEVQQTLLDMEANEGLSADAARRAALVREMEELTARAANGDKQAAARLKEIQSELVGIEGRSPAGGVAGGGGTVAERRQALLQELSEVAARAAAGDPAAIARMKEIQKELAALEESDPNRGSTLARKRRELVDELGAMTDMTATGNLEAAERVQAIQRELSSLSAIELAAQNPADMIDPTALLEGRVPQLDLIDQQILLDLTPTQFQNFLKINVPHAVIDVEIVSHRSKLRVQGALFNQQEYDRLKRRLKPAEPRIDYEVRVDPWGVCRKLEDKLKRNGVKEVRVHAHLMPNDNKLFVQYQKDRAIGDDQVRAIATPFVVDENLLRIQGFRATGARSRR